MTGIANASCIDGVTCERRDGGFVLIAVIGTLLILSLLAGAFVFSVRTETTARIAATANTQATVYADGLVRLAALRVAEARSSGGVGKQFAVDGSPWNCRDGEMSAAIAVQDVVGLVDLNDASLALLTRLLRGVGVPAERASGLAAAIVDFRDGDDVETFGGAEAAAYQRTGYKHGPKNAPFDSVVELDQVLGMTPELFERLKPLVTVHARRPFVDAGVAPMALLQAMALSATPVARDSFVVPAEMGPSGAVRAAGSRARIIGIDVTVAQDGGGAFRRAAVVEFMPNAETGFQVREWRGESVPLRARPRSDGAVACLTFPQR